MLAKIHYAHVPPLTCIYHIPDTLARVSALGPSVHAHPSKPPVHCCVRVPQGTVHAARSTRSEILGEKSCRCVCLFVSAHVCLQCMQTVKASGDKVFVSVHVCLQCMQTVKASGDKVFVSVHVCLQCMQTVKASGDKVFVSAHVCLQCMQTVKASGDKGRSPQYRCARINGMDGKRTLPVFPWFVFTQQQLPTPACCKIHII